MSLTLEQTSDNAAFSADNFDFIDENITGTTFMRCKASGTWFQYVYDANSWVYVELDIYGYLDELLAIYIQEYHEALMTQAQMTQAQMTQMREDETHIDQIEDYDFEPPSDEKIKESAILVFMRENGYGTIQEAIDAMNVAEDDEYIKEDRLETSACQQAVQPAVQPAPQMTSRPKIAEISKECRFNRSGCRNLSCKYWHSSQMISRPSVAGKAKFCNKEACLNSSCWFRHPGQDGPLRH
jgi:hypothetical protein